MRRMTSRWVLLVGSVTCAFVAAWRTEICEARSGNGRAHLRNDMERSLHLGDFKNALDLGSHGRVLPQNLSLLQLLVLLLNVA